MKAMPIQSESDIFTTVEAAEYLGFAEDTVRQYIRRGLIHAVAMGPIWAITRSECDRYLKEKMPRGNPNLKAKKPVRRNHKNKVGKI